MYKAGTRGFKDSIFKAKGPKPVIFKAKAKQVTFKAKIRPVVFEAKAKTTK